MSYRREFLDSFEGRKHQYWSRLKNAIFISFEVDKFQTKRSKSIAENLRFQNFLLSEMNTKNRRCFRGNVAVEFIFHVNQNNPPAIQSLLKHYIDLIQRPLKGLNATRDFLLIKDDSQIKALSAFYWREKESKKQEFTIIIKPIRDFIFSLEFAKDLELENFPERKKRSLFEEDRYEESRRRVEDFDNSISENLKDIKIVSDGEELDFLKYRNQILEEERNQELLTINSRISASSLLALITEPESNKKVNSIFDISLNLMGRATTLKGLFNMNFGSVPVSEGESSLFKDRINQEIKDWKKRRGKRLPKNPALSLKFFYEKPNKVNHDLDNLLRYVLPHFNTLINKDRHFKDVTSIEIYQIQTVSKNKDSGNLYLRIEGIGSNNMFHVTQDLLEKYV